MYCCKSLNKQSSGVQEWINSFYINSCGENSFFLRTFRFTNDLQERIKFVNRGLTVYFQRDMFQPLLGHLQALWENRSKSCLYFNAFGIPQYIEIRIALESVFPEGLTMT